MTLSPPGQLVEQLLAENLLTPDQCEAVLHRMQSEGMLAEDALIETGVIAEYDLLKYLARMFRTRFVVTSKLARVDLDRALLELLPREVAERYTVFPVLFDPGSSTLSVVAPDAGNPELAQAVQSHTNVRDVRVFVARPAAVRAAIQKHYGGDLYAFANADSSGREQYMSLLDMYDRGAVQTDPATNVSVGRERMLTERDLGARSRQTPAQTRRDVFQPVLEASSVLISLLENNRGDLRGHSILVSRWMRKLAERIRVGENEALLLALAGLFHDVGKTATYHLTALNVAQFESHRAVAQKSYLSPLRLFEAVPLEPTTSQAIEHMYERFDGGGFPQGLSGKDIPLGARLLSLLDTYSDLTLNARNPFRRVLSPSDACDMLDRQRATVFDPNLIDLLRHTVTGDDLRARLLADRPGVLLIDPDPEESTVLELRMLEEGFDVRVARSADEALGLMSRGTTEVCIAETEIGPASGFELLMRVRGGNTLSSNLPWVFLTRDARRESISRGFELGANDYVIKPAPTEVLVAKVRQILGQRGARVARGVSGSLAELALTDVIQVLAQGRKSGQLRIRSGSEQGEIHLLDGAVVNALWGTLRGEDAFYAMLSLDDGDFSLDASFRPATRVITATVEALLLEGLKRLDEDRS